MASSAGVWTPLAKTYDPIRIGNIDGTENDVHDKAIWRAVNSSYRPNKGVAGNKSCTLFVGRLSLKTEEETLRNIFQKYGDIEKIRVVRDLVTGYSKGYAFIEYKSHGEVSSAHSHANGIFIDGTKIVVEFEHERSMLGWIPRRLGGGFGGKKESGQLRFGGRDRPFKKPYHEQQRHYSPEVDMEHQRHKDYRFRQRGYGAGDRNYSRRESRSKPYDKRIHSDRRR